MNSVVKATSYMLYHTPDMVLHNGTTQTTERDANPDSEYLKELPSCIRTYEAAVSYLPNQTYIGNLTPEELAKHPQPWHEADKTHTNRFGRFGQIMPEDEFYLLMQACDVFDIVHLDADFVLNTKEKFLQNPCVTKELAERIRDGKAVTEIEKIIKDEHGEGLYLNGMLVGAVSRGHDVDENLSAHVLLENLVSKAGSVMSLLQVIRDSKINPSEIEYVIDCSEEACGDMNQRGGGNFAKASAEIAGLENATGADIRAFCAAPVHALITAAALVKAGVYKNIAITAGGSVAKLGMNGKDHLKKGAPVLEDVLAGFAVIISENDGISPEINLDIVGRHSVGTGSSPQAVLTSLVAAPLEKAGFKISDVDKYSTEMQNPDVTLPAGAGDVPLSNYKMIAALAVKRGEIERTDLPAFPAAHGMVGWAPTQGHIPSGIPYVGFAVQEIMEARIQRAMIVGKGSLFLGRMTNLFDGVSVILQANSGSQAEEKVSEAEVRQLIAESMKQFASTILNQGSS